MGKSSKGGGGTKASKHEIPSTAGANKKGAVAGRAGSAAVASGSSSSVVATSGSGSYNLEIREGCVALMRFRSRDAMNALLDPISNAIEGVIINRLGHNFALLDSARDHVAFRKACALPNQVRRPVHTNVKFS